MFGIILPDYVPVHIGAPGQKFCGPQNMKVVVKYYQTS